MAEHKITSSDLSMRERVHVWVWVCMCMCALLSTHTFVFVCVSRGVILDGFMTCKDVCHIGSGGKQYPFCNRRKKKGFSLFFSLSLSLFLSFSGFMSFLSFPVSLSSMNTRTFSCDCCQATNSGMPNALWSVEYCLPVWN